MREALRLMVPIVLAAMLNPLNTSLVVTALAPISADLGVAAGDTAVLVAVLYLASATVQPVAGRLADDFGPRRVMVTGSLVLGLGAAIGWTATNLAGLVVARILIGLGGAGAYPAGMLLIQRAAHAAGETGPPRGRLAVLNVVGQATVAAGLPAGGFLVELAGWRGTFAVNVPLALLAVVTALVLIERDPPGPPRRGSLARQLDLAGILLFAAALIALLGGLLISSGAATGVLLAIGAVASAVFVRHELRVPTPFLDLRALVGNGALSRTYLRTGIGLVGVYVVLYALPLWLQDRQGFAPSAVAFLTVPVMVVGVVASIAVARMRAPWLPLAAAALASLGGAGALVVSVLAAATVLPVLVATALFGIVMGATSAANQQALYVQADPGRLGTAAGLMRTAHFLDSIWSTALVGVAFQHGVTDGGLLVIAAVVAVASVLMLALAVGDRALRRT
ncbi:Major Facilitator Superfamily protein [Pseudonocardia thermophila]|uniref:Major Facilitator Superfamily protein n=1 Tax=Pseudonocardia thermophila TaxID=1848 RepID=A0A1M6PPS1_PSETH|nr:MFS transporter [Pseudonocardia thermophila]SHK09929.1 Major Facilitator Superfamily protein [Pseudonocardia thermophila]